jgi:hypothetical protein
MAEGVMAQDRSEFIGLASGRVDIERICQESSELEKPPSVLLVSSRSIGNSLLAVRVEFLEDGQLLAWPGMQLVGATFDPDWGLTRVEFEMLQENLGEFQVPHGPPDTFTNGDTWGYRLCPIDSHEIPDVIRQLAQLRVELAKPRQRSKDQKGVKVSVTDL